MAGLRLISVCLLLVGGAFCQNVLYDPNGNIDLINKGHFIPGNHRDPVITGNEPRASISELRSHLLYPFALRDLTTVTSTKTYHDQALQFQIPFFGFRYTYVWIHKDGYLAFNQGQRSYKFPVRFPRPPSIRLTEGQDPSLIAPFFAIQDIPELENAGVYSRVIEMEKEPDVNLREAIYMDFREGMIGSQDFRPKFVIIVTWKDMTYANKAPDFDTKTNTYQAVLATDEMRTYVMFNYAKIDWISGFFEGTKGPSAYVGFNAGNSTRTFEFSPYSQMPRVSLLPRRGYGNGHAGRFYFQIDEEVWPGACVEKDLDPNLPDRMPLTFFPRIGNMLGGTMVDVTGPCLLPDSVITCTFENWKTAGIFRDRNRATCILPPVMYHGYVDLTIRVGERTSFYGRFYVQPPDIANNDVVIIGDTDRQEEPGEIEIKWRPEKLVNLPKNSADVNQIPNAPAQLTLWGYREDSNYPNLTFIDTLADVQLAAGKYVMDVTQFQTRNNPGLTNIVFGFIALTLNDPSQVLGKEFKHSPVIWSRPMPLAWYFRNQWERQYGSNGKWKTTFCENWFRRESRSDTFALTLFRCPCTLRQAQLDKGRFSPDLECNVVDRKCDTFHRGALHCVKSGRPSIGGSGQTCCYDDYGELIQTADTMYGGRPSRAFVYGKHPFKMQMMIPLLSQYLHDIAPFFFCCKWQEKQDNSDTCQMYNYWRTSQDCSNYQAPAVASIYGDPHLVTFDKTSYTFNGRGEFTLVHVDNAMHKFELQGRFEQLPQPDVNTAPLKATTLKAIAAAENTSSIVEFRIRPIAASWRYKMYVIVDKEYVYWWDESMKLQNFRGVTLFQPAGITNMSHVIAQFDSGAGVEVVANEGHMSVHVFAPYTFKNNTRGLLGYYSGDPIDDFKLVGDDRSIPITSPVETIYSEMHKNYRVSDKVKPGDLNQQASLFHHDAVAYTYYDDPLFQPEFRPQLPEFAKNMEQQMHETCSDSLPCQYDFIQTLDPDYARITKQEETKASTLHTELNTMAIRCPALAKPANGRKSENRYWPGTIVRFSCHEGYRLVGYETRKCRPDGLWSWGVEAECITNTSYYLQVSGIGIGILIPLIIVIVFIVLFFIFQRNGRDYHTQEQGEFGHFEETRGSEKGNESLHEQK